MIRRSLAAAFLLLSITATVTNADEWISLFDGKDLSQWEPIRNKIDNWKIEDGVFYCSSGGGWLATKEEFDNFELELEFKLCKGGNSGVFLRAPLEGDPAWTGLEVQIIDNFAPEYAKLEPYQYCGGLYGCDAPSAKVAKGADEWQKYRIVANGRKIQVTLNDTPIIDSDLDKHADKIKEHPGINRTTGRIGLQEHGGRIDFRNVRVKRLPANP